MQSTTMTIVPGDEEGQVVNFNIGNTAKEAYPLTDEELLKVIQEMEQDSGLLPPAVRWVSQTGRYAIFERPPHMVTINFFGTELAKVSQATEQKFTIALPWTVYGIEMGLDNRISNIYLFCRSTSIEDEYSQLYSMPLTNLYDDGRFCLRPHTDSGATLGETISLAYNEVWHSDFNLDVVANVERAFQFRVPDGMFESVPAGVTSSAASLLRHWEKFSIQDVLRWNHWLVPNWNHPSAADVDGELEFCMQHLITHFESLDNQFYSSPNYFMNNLRIKLQSKG